MTTAMAESLGLTLGDYLRDPSLRLWTSRTWVFYTDASQSIDPRVQDIFDHPPSGIATVWLDPQDGWSGRLMTAPSVPDINDAEMAAVKLCLKYLDQRITRGDTRAPEDIVIWTDSQETVDRIGYLRGLANRSQELYELAVGAAGPETMERIAGMLYRGPPTSNIGPPVIGQPPEVSRPIPESSGTYLDYGEPDGSSSAAIEEEPTVDEPRATPIGPVRPAQDPNEQTRPGLHPSVARGPRYGYRRAIWGDRSVFEHIRDIEARGIRVWLRWCRGHVGFVGNSIADDAAKNARWEAETGTPPMTPFRYYVTELVPVSVNGRVVDRNVAGRRTERLPYSIENADLL